MVYFQLAALVSGLVLLVVGYRRNLRKVLFSAAIVLFLAGAGADLSKGFLDGYQGRIASQ